MAHRGVNRLMHTCIEASKVTDALPCCTLDGTQEYAVLLCVSQYRLNLGVVMLLAWRQGTCANTIACMVWSDLGAFFDWQPT